MRCCDWVAADCLVFVSFWGVGIKKATQLLVTELLLVLLLLRWEVVMLYYSAAVSSTAGAAGAADFFERRVRVAFFSAFSLSMFSL